MPTYTGRVTWTTDVSGMTATVWTLVEPHPPMIEEPHRFLVPEFLRDDIRAGLKGTVTVDTQATETTPPETAVRVSVR